MKIKKVGKLKQPRGKQVGYGVVEVEGVEIDFRIYPSKNGGVFGSFPSVKTKEGNWFDQVRLNKQAKADFERLLNEAWDRKSGGSQRQEKNNNDYGDEDIPF